ncbi:hypothetical protein A6V39_05010 [Candidatus Mycoplasma haematobovis]|uniref:Uncharacterized protein n=1 Tax=Candidatus Mycoplasma haematobovis TaxID=432608 RepID=A0A1A9QBE8_9MOLU|nr:hypothetical protein [Candidatus Mycoplasma haematobovis]OAL09787.1 hypothetical protein A6V39_05010 [Candidatus Mycoplasma haematobovis]
MAGGVVIVGGIIGAVHLSNRETPISELLKSETTKVVLGNNGVDELKSVSWKNILEILLKINKNFESTCKSTINEK